MGLLMIGQRFFRSTPQTYELVRTTLDGMWGFPNAGTVTCFTPATDIAAPKDASGNVLLAVDASWCEWEDVAPILTQLLDIGQVVEVDRQEYQAAVDIIVLPSAEVEIAEPQPPQLVAEERE